MEITLDELKAAFGLWNHLHRAGQTTGHAATDAMELEALSMEQAVAFWNYLLEVKAHQ